MNESSNLQMEEDLVELGVAGAAIGVRGEIRLNLYSDSDRNIFEGQRIYLSRRGSVRYLTVQSKRLHKGFPVVKFEEISDRNEASTLTGSTIFIRSKDLKELAEGEVYVRDLIGLKVLDRVSNTEIGKVKDVLTNTAQPVYVIEREKGKDVLIPGVPIFIKEIRLEEGIIEIELIPEFIEDED